MVSAGSLGDSGPWYGIPMSSSMVRWEVVVGHHGKCLTEVVESETCCIPIISAFSPRLEIGDNRKSTIGAALPVNIIPSTGGTGHMRGQGLGCIRHHIVCRQHIPSQHPPHPRSLQWVVVAMTCLPSIHEIEPVLTHLMA